MKRFPHSIPTILAAAALAACGGGGGSSPTEVSATAGPPVALSDANYETAANEAAAAGLKTVDSGIEGNLLAGVATPRAPDWIALGRQRVADWRSLLRTGAPVVAGTTTTDTINCQGGGSLRFTFNDLNGNNDLDAGDSVSVTASSCVQDGTTMAGALSITMDSTPIGDPSSSAYSLAMTMAFNGMAVSNAGVTYTGNGILQLSSARTNWNTGTDSISSQAFSSSMTVPGSAALVRTVNDFAATVNWTPTETTTNLGGVVTSSALNGHSVSIATTTPFKRLYNTSDYPYTGVAVATGANGTVTLTVPNATTVRVDLDVGGDGSIERSIEKNWSSIQ